MFKQLSELNFKDMYVRVDPDVPDDFPSRYHRKPRRGEPSGPGNHQVPDEFREAIRELRILLRGFPKDNFAFDTQGLRMRGVRYTVVDKTVWCSLRRIATDLPVLEDLGFTPDVLKVFRSWGKRTGLIIVGGATGSGKTTTSVALLRDFLRNQGGTLYTIEDPVEFVMQGQLGESGFVIQREVQEDEEWGEAVKDALRSAPNYIFLGEVRTAAAARQLLRAATSGHLALCTVHGSSVEETIGAIIQIAERELGPLAYNLLAEGLTGVIYQNIVRGKPQVGLLETSDGKGGVDAVRVAVRANKLIMLGTQIEQQAALRSKAAARASRREGQGGTGDDEEGDGGAPAAQAPMSSGPPSAMEQRVAATSGQPMAANAVPRGSPPSGAAGGPSQRPVQRSQVQQVQQAPVQKKSWFSK